MANPHPKTDFSIKKNRSAHKLSKEDMRKGGINSQKKQAELRKQKELFNSMLKEVMSNGKTKQLNIGEKLYFMAMRPEATFDNVLKFHEYMAKLNGELVEKQEITNNQPIIIKTTKKQEEEARKKIQDFIKPKEENE